MALIDSVRKFLGIDKQIQREVNKQMTSTLEEFKLVEIQQDRQFRFRQVENQIWFRGNPSDLEKFYKQKRYPNEQYNTYFWREVTGKLVKIHYPLPSAISRHMSAILFGEDINLKVDAGSESLSKQLQERLDLILAENNIKELLERGAQIESYSGSLGAKIVIDPEFSDVPQIQFYPAEQIDLSSKYGKVYEICFNDDYVYDNNKYKLKSIYGKGYIHYELYDKDGRMVKLQSVPELASLKDVVFLGPDGKPIKLLMAAFKPNRAVSTEFVETNYGASDYEGLYGIFQALDELISAWNDYYRNGRIITFISEDNLMRDPTTGNAIPINKFGINDVILYDATTNNTKSQEVKRDIPELDVKPFRDGFKNLIEVALQRAGLSPISFGMDSVSVISSGETLNVREKITLKTRQDKIKLWKEFLSKLLKLAMIFDSLQSASPSVSSENITYRLSELMDHKFMAEFPQYSSPSREEQIRILAQALEGKLIDIDTAVRELYKDEYTDEQLKTIVENIKKENPTSGEKPKEELLSQEEIDNEEEMEVKEVPEEPEEELEDEGEEEEDEAEDEEPGVQG
jgi:hypothetical protein